MPCGEDITPVTCLCVEIIGRDVKAMDAHVPTPADYHHLQEYKRNVHFREKRELTLLDFCSEK